MRGADRDWDGADRDRDAAGRARNARPRDGLGRPLERSAAGEPTVPDGLALEPAPALALAQQLIDSGRPFHAHEVLEATWRAAPPADRDLWRGLTQLAVGLTHALRGNARGATTLLSRGAAAVSGSPAASRYDIDAAQLAAAAAELADRIETAGLAAIRGSDLRLRLVTDTRR